MPASALVQTRIDPEVKERAAAVLGAMGLTVSDAVRMLLTRTANEGASLSALPTPTPMTPGSGARCRRRGTIGDRRFHMKKLRRIYRATEGGDAQG